MSASLREAGDGWTREGLPLLRAGWIRDASDWPRGARASHGLSERAASLVCALSGRPSGGPWDMGLGGEAPAPSSPGERVPVVEWQGCARECWQVAASCGRSARGIGCHTGRSDASDVRTHRFRPRAFTAVWGLGCWCQSPRLWCRKIHEGIERLSSCVHVRPRGEAWSVPVLYVGFLCTVDWRVGDWGEEGVCSRYDAKRGSGAWLTPRGTKGSR